MTSTQNDQTKANLQREIVKKHLHLQDEESIRLTLDFLAELHRKSPSSFQGFDELVKHNGGEDFDTAFLREIYNSLNSSSSESAKTDAAIAATDTLLGNVFEGRVISIRPYGAFIRFNNTSGLCHISQVSYDGSRIAQIDLQPNQKVFVKVINEGRDNKGKISLSMRGINQKSGVDESQERSKSNRTCEKRVTRPETHSTISSDKIHHEPEIETEIELNDARPSFLRNQEYAETNPSINTILSMEGAMSKAAENGSDFARKFREEKLQKEKEKNKASHQRIDPLAEKDKTEKVISEWKASHKLSSFQNPTKRSIEEQKKSLPVYDMRGDLIQSIRDNQFIVIVGETGSGKTTQIVQYIYEEGLNVINGESKIIGCTQPRRVAATSVAKRVSEEVGCDLGDEVGYNVRFDDKTTLKTKIKYMTDGMLEREALTDPEMSKYAVIMLDEAHERTIATDVLFALLKKAALTNPNLKIIVTSATLDSDKFSVFFNECPILNIPGRTYPVEVLYTKEPEMDYLSAALDTVMQIHISEPSGDILVFLTGQEEIDTSCEVLAERVKVLGDVASELIILPVYSALPAEMQTKIFEPTPPGSRKVILATNIAETSITIDGIYYVVDPGYVKLNAYDSKSGMDTLKISPISKAQANQRSGRAGRTGPGKCYRLYTEQSYTNEMLPNTIPEIQRQNLSHTILMLKAIGIKDVIQFEFMDPPSKNSMMTSLEDLYMLEALDDDGELTPLGRKMADFPMEPALAKTLIKSVDLNCTEEILTIVAMLSVQTIFHRPKDRQNLADQRKARFHSTKGDHLTLLNVYNRWCASKYNKDWCRDNFIQERSMRHAKEVRKQLQTIMTKHKYSVNSCGPDLDAVRKTLCCGYFKNVAKRDSGEGYKTLSKNETVYLHPSSSQFGKNPEYLLYHAIVMTSREYMHHVTVIDPEWLCEFAPKYFKLADPHSQARKKQKIVPLESFGNRNQKKPLGWWPGQKK
ncbi:Prp22 RNA-dependent ATPase [Candida orthopsilosis Co 90-125]|uniref:RNA helicase n=1 Tax=Candida orthopsilosis (strain 90-125) TaxID=1136231 RepID=H8X8V7_CANO9|nr:Prp22 RNA-dependent ATPase [Candida orthopsilosis Co 90-125]CCG24255.1 Prp22 RNA-dependent ATPase [Candida orthopsilosis Co 90-125]